MSCNLQSKIYVAGHGGMVGSALMRMLRETGYTNIVTSPRNLVDLTNQNQVNEFFLSETPDQVYLAAAKVGGIHANNTYPAEFIYQNLMIQANVINAAFLSGVKKLLFLGSSCIYPRAAPQPMREDVMLTGPLESTNEPYAIAKIAGSKLCESYNRQYGKTHDIDYRSVMPTNLYGPGDNYHPENSHVIPGLIRKFHDAKQKNDSSVTIWGTGVPRREFLYVDDMARACILVMNINKTQYKEVTQPMFGHINIGIGSDVAIKELSEIIRSVVGYAGGIHFDPSKPDGVPQKLLDSTIISQLGWFPQMSLSQGLERAYSEYLASI